MQIRGVVIPPLITHFFVFLLGTFATIPLESDCQIDLEGLLLSTKGTLEKKLSKHEFDVPLYLIISHSGEKCRLSELPFFSRKDSSDGRIFVYLEPVPGSAKIIETLWSSHRFQITRRGDLFPPCLSKGKVFYGH